jgi:hypothetical protein
MEPSRIWRKQYLQFLGNLMIGTVKIRRSLENNIKVDLKNPGYEYMDW